MGDENTVRVGAALRALAADPRLAEGFKASPAVREALWPAAARYVVARDTATAVSRMAALAARGYEVGLECVGENARDADEVDAVVAQYQALLERLPQRGLSTRTELNFDLSHLGLLVSPQLAFDAARTIAAAAHRRGVDVTLSMERSSQTDLILRTFTRLAGLLPNMGITLQAYLHRTPTDLAAVLHTGGRVRLVKGVYDEPPEVALPRGAVLDARFLGLATTLQRAGVPFSLATHDPVLIRELVQRRLLDGGEIEMLHGVRPELLRTLREQGLGCRIYGTFGDHWYLHLLHRLAECPDHLFQALADIADPQRVVAGAGY